MARFDVTIDEMTASGGADMLAGEALFELGLAYATGRDESGPDLVNAHKWFNLAVMKGNAQAMRYRQEIAAELSAAEIASAQRAAREWLSRH